MSSYPPGGDYDERLLDSAPKATKAERQEGYNVNLLASDNSDAPMNAKPPATVDGHTLEAGALPTKESFSSSCSVPWYRQNKWRIFMLMGAIIVIGAIIGGAVGGTLASKNDSPSPSPSNGTGPAVNSGLPPTPTSSSTTPLGAPQPADSGAPTGGTTNSIISATAGGPVTNTRPVPTPGIGGDNINGVADSGPVVAPVVVWSD